MSTNKILSLHILKVKSDNITHIKQAVMDLKKKITSGGT